MIFKIKRQEFRNFSLIKDKIIAILITLVLGLLFFEFSNPNLTHDILWNIFIIDSLCCLVFQINFFLNYLWLHQNAGI